MKLEKIVKTSLKILGAAVISIALAASECDIDNKVNIPEGFKVSTGWTVTSYGDVNEKVYDGEKIEVFNASGNSLGFYKTDFLEQVRINGSGKGDSINNNGKFLHYDYDVNDLKTHYLVDKSLGAYSNGIVQWTGDKPSVAVNPPLPYGTEIKFVDLGPDAINNPAWVNKLLLSKTFYADDKFFLDDSQKHEKKIDIYVGLQKVKDMNGTPESLLMHDVTICVQD